MREQGYARYSLHRQVLLAACLSEWCFLATSFGPFRRFNLADLGPL